MKGRRLIIFAGTIMPLFAIAFSTWVVVSFFGGLREELLHTVGHILLVLTVPVANWCLVKSLERNKDGVSLELSFYNGFAVSVALIYCAILIPLVPRVLMMLFLLGSSLVAAPFVLVPAIPYAAEQIFRPESWALMFAIGSGLLGVSIGFSGMLAAVFSPMTGFCIGQLLACRNQESQVRHRGKSTAYCLGFFIGLAIVLAYDCHSFVFRASLVSLGDNHGDRERAAVRLMRGLGSDKELLSLCYQDPAPLLDICTLLFRMDQQPLAASSARQLYYRVTGQSFNEMHAPKRTQKFLWFETAGDDDADLAADEVGGRAEGLALTKSALRGQVNADYAVAALNWQIAFRNSTQIDKEARAEILLPPGAVISGATLCMNGTDKSAQFFETTEARRIYRDIVLSQRRDPLLLRSCGRDRVLMQCFPVPPNSTMHLSLSISAPVQYDQPQRGRLFMPCLVEKNFDVSTQHSLDLMLQEGHESRWLHKQLQDDAMAAAEIELHKTLPGNSLRSFSTAEGTVEQNLERVEVKQFTRFEVVVDASKSMNKHLPEILSYLRSLPKDCYCDVFLASDEIGGCAGDSTHPLTLDAAAKELREIKFTGGPDNVPALLAAARYAELSKRGAIVWLHGPQPILFDSSRNQLSLLLSEHHSGISLLDVPIVDGPNRVTEALETTFTPFKPALIVCQRQSRYAVVRHCVQGQFSEQDEEGVASEQAGKLWHFAQVMNSVSKRDLAAAIKVGLESRLVTPVTAAIVYEPYERYFTRSWMTLLKSHPHPGLDGVIDSTPSVEWQMLTSFPICDGLNKAIDEAFKAVVSQLNHLSSASGAVPAAGYSAATAPLPSGMGGYGLSSYNSSQFSSVSSRLNSMSRAASPNSATVSATAAPTPGSPIFTQAVVPGGTVPVNGEPHSTDAQKSAGETTSMSDRTPAERSLQTWVTCICWTVLSLNCTWAVLAILSLGKGSEALSSRKRNAVRIAMAIALISSTILAGQILVPTVRDLICLWC